VDLHIAVVDGKPAQRGQQMFDRADGDARVIAQHRAQRQVLDVTNIGGDLGDDAAAPAHEKTVARVDLPTMQHHRNGCAAVNSRTGQLDLAANRRLARSDKSLRHCAMSLGPLVGADHPVVPDALAPVRHPSAIAPPNAWTYPSIWSIGLIRLGL